MAYDRNDCCCVLLLFRTSLAVRNPKHIINTRIYLQALYAYMYIVRTYEVIRSIRYTAQSAQSVGRLGVPSLCFVCLIFF